MDNLLEKLEGFKDPLEKKWMELEEDLQDALQN
jgi:hypothetical protein